MYADRILFKVEHNIGTHTVNGEVDQYPPPLPEEGIRDMTLESNPNNRELVNFDGTSYDSIILSINQTNIIDLNHRSEAIAVRNLELAARQEETRTSYFRAQ
jgi:hypothetical protein